MEVWLLFAVRIFGNSLTSFKAVERLQRAEKESESSLKDLLIAVSNCGTKGLSFVIPLPDQTQGLCRKGKLIACSAFSQSGNEAKPILGGECPPSVVIRMLENGGIWSNIFHRSSRSSAWMFVETHSGPQADMKMGFPAILIQPWTGFHDYRSWTLNGLPHDFDIFWGFSKWSPIGFRMLHPFKDWS